MSKLGHESLLDRCKRDAFYLFNCAQQALSPKCVIFLERLALAEIPNMKRSREQILEGIGPRFKARAIMIPNVSHSAPPTSSLFGTMPACCDSINSLRSIYLEVDPDERYEVQGFQNNFKSDSIGADELLDEMIAWNVEELRSIVPQRYEFVTGGRSAPATRDKRMTMPGTAPGYEQHAQRHDPRYTEQEWQDFYGQWSKEEWDRWTDEQRRHSRGYEGFKSRNR